MLIDICPVRGQHRDSTHVYLLTWELSSLWSLGLPLRQSFHGSVQADLDMIGCAPIEKPACFTWTWSCCSGSLTSGLKLASFCFFGMPREEQWAGCTCSCRRGAARAVFPPQWRNVWNEFVTCFTRVRQLSHAFLNQQAPLALGALWQPHIKSKAINCIICIRY